MNKKTTLVNYLRKPPTPTNAKGEAYGVVVAVEINLPGRSCVSMGWSRCGKGDLFDKNIGIKMAIGRANTGTNATVKPDVEVALNQMRSRAQRYFKDKPIISMC